MGASLAFAVYKQGGSVAAVVADKGCTDLTQKIRESLFRGNHIGDGLH